MTLPRLGLALGCGSARGWAHIGVIRALEERGLRPQVVVGASVGALVAASHAGGRLAQLEKWVRALTQREVWRLVDTKFRGGGIMTGNRLMDAIATSVGDPLIEELDLGFAAVASDLEINLYPADRFRDEGLRFVAAAFSDLHRRGESVTREGLLSVLADKDEAVRALQALEPLPDARHHAESFLARLAEKERLREAGTSVESVVRARKDFPAATP